MTQQSSPVVGWGAQPAGQPITLQQPVGSPPQPQYSHPPLAHAPGITPPTVFGYTNPPVQPPPMTPPPGPVGGMGQLPLQVQQPAAMQQPAVVPLQTTVPHTQPTLFDRLPENQPPFQPMAVTALPAVINTGTNLNPVVGNHFINAPAQPPPAATQTQPAFNPTAIYSGPAPADGQGRCLGVLEIKPGWMPTGNPLAAQAPLPVQVQQPQATTPAATTTEQPSIQQLLRNFGNQAGCERYKGDAEKVKLLEDYLWIRRLTPSLSFELFLELYAPVADFDEKNLKHPADAVKYYLPRTKKAADERATHHWASKEVVDYVALYVDMIRAAEATSEPVPMVLNQFLSSEHLLKMFHEGAFKEAATKQAPATRQSGTRAPKSNEKVRPSGVGQRVIFTAQSGRQQRGMVTGYWQDEQTSHIFADFRADAGEEFKGIGINNFEVCADPPPNPPQTLEGDPLPELGCCKLTITKAQFPSVKQALSLPVAVGTVAIGDTIYSFNHTFPTGHVAVLDVVNGETGPYVDARLCLNNPANVLVEINPPRKNIEGVYVFETPEGTFNLEVSGNL